MFQKFHRKKLKVNSSLYTISSDNSTSIGWEEIFFFCQFLFTNLSVFLILYKLKNYNLKYIIFILFGLKNIYIE